MPVHVEVEVLGESRLRGWLAAASGVFGASLFAATAKAVEIEANAIRADTPRLTGELVGSIGTKVTREGDGVKGEVFSTSQHARFVEFGTRQHGRAQRMFARGQGSSKTAVRAEFRSAVAKVADTF